LVSNNTRKMGNHDHRSSYILALDQGTTSSRAILYDLYGNMCGMKQKEFAEKIGISQSELGNIEGGKIAIKIDTVRKANSG